MERIAQSIVNRQAFTAALLASATPYLCGVICAERNDPFCPEEFFAHDGDMLEFAEGFEAVKGESDITRDFKRGIVEAVDLEDYREWILDNDYHARGMW